MIDFASLTESPIVEAVKSRSFRGGPKINSQEVHLGFVEAVVDRVQYEHLPGYIQVENHSDRLRVPYGSGFVCLPPDAVRREMEILSRYQGNTLRTDGQWELYRYIMQTSGIPEKVEQVKRRLQQLSSNIASAQESGQDNLEKWGLDLLITSIQRNPFQLNGSTFDLLPPVGLKNNEPIQLPSNQRIADRIVMELCIDQSVQAVLCGEHPFGAAITRPVKGLELINEIVLIDQNRQINGGYAQHAEIVALGRFQYEGFDDNGGITIFSNVEPCEGCVSAFIGDYPGSENRRSLITRIVYGVGSHMGGARQINDFYFRKARTTIDRVVKVESNLMVYDIYSLLSDYGWSEMLAPPSCFRHREEKCEMD